MAAEPPPPSPWTDQIPPTPPAGFSPPNKLDPGFLDFDPQPIPVQPIAGVGTIDVPGSSIHGEATPTVNIPEGPGYPSDGPETPPIPEPPPPVPPPSSPPVDCSCMGGIASAIASVALAISNPASTVNSNTTTVVNSVTSTILQTSQTILNETSQVITEITNILNDFSQRYGIPSPINLTVPVTVNVPPTEPPPVPPVPPLPPPPPPISPPPPPATPKVPLIIPPPCQPPETWTRDQSDDFYVQYYQLCFDQWNKSGDVQPDAAQAQALARVIAGGATPVTMGTPEDCQVPIAPPPNVQVMGAQDCLTVAGIVPAVNQSWCERLNAVRKYLVSLGAQLLAPPTEGGQAGAAAADCIILALSNVMQSDANFVAEAVDNIKKWVRNAWPVTVLELWKEEVRQAWSDGSDDALCIQAAKTVLRALIAEGTNLSKSLSHDLAAGANTPFIQIRDTTATNRSYALGTHIVYFFTPLLELCDLCLQFYEGFRTASVDEALRLWQRGLLDQATAQCLVKYAGADWTEQLRRLPLLKNQLGAESVIEWGRRQGWNKNQVDALLQQTGWTDPSDANALEGLYDEVPGLADVIAFATRKVLDQATIDKEGLNEGIDDFVTNYGNPALSVNGHTSQDAAKYWRAHWKTLDIGTALDAYRRLRPGRYVPALAFTRDDLELVFQQNAIPPWLRQRLVTLADKPISLRYLATAFRYGSIDLPNLIEGLMDLGYSAEDAATMGNALDTQRLRQLQTEAHGWTLANLKRLFDLHQIDELFVRQKMQDQRYTADQVSAFINVIELDRNARDRDKFLSALKKQYEHGCYTAAAARDAMIRYGLDLTRSNELLTEWTNETLISVCKLPPTNLVNWYKEGILSAPELMARLTAMGYTAVDANRVLLTANQALTVAQQKQAAKDLAAAQKAAQAAAKVRAAAQKAAAKKLNLAAKVKAEAAVAKAKAAEVEALANLKIQTAHAIGDASPGTDTMTIKEKSALAAAELRAELTITEAEIKIAEQEAQV